MLNIAIRDQSNVNLHIGSKPLNLKNEYNIIEESSMKLGQRKDSKNGNFQLNVDTMKF